MIAGAIAKMFLTDADARAVAIRAKLATYADAKAIFTVALPDDAPFPALLIAEVGGPAWGCRANTGGVMAVDIQVFNDKDSSRKATWELAHEVWRLIDRHPLTPYLSDVGFENWGVIADMPVNTQDGLGFPGYTIKTSVRVLSTA
ncbi:MAG: hypothetical protein AMXMBFR7_32980 [Planctomycetota bacterium]